MIKYFLLFLLPFSLYASKILSYNIYERSDRADVMITFDTPYNGIIKQSKSTSKIIIKLQNASIESSRIKKVNSNYLHALTITPMKNQTQILASISPNVRLIASKTADAYGLRLRFTKKVAAKSSNANAKTREPNLSALPTKQGTEMSTSYYVVVGALFIGIIVLLVLKKRIAFPVAKKQKESWLFNSTQEAHNTQVDVPLQETPANTTTVSIRFQKAINTQNSVVMLDFGKESYLVLMGNSNILLEKFKDNQPSSQQEFESILQERNQELEDFLGQEPLQAYKERAASRIYSDES